MKIAIIKIPDLVHFSLHGEPRELSQLDQGIRGTVPSVSDSKTRLSLTQQKGHHPKAHRIQWINGDLDLGWVKKEKSDSSNSSLPEGNRITSQGKQLSILDSLTSKNPWIILYFGVTRQCINTT